MLLTERPTKGGFFFFVIPNESEESRWPGKPVDGLLAPDYCKIAWNTDEIPPADGMTKRGARELQLVAF